MSLLAGTTVAMYCYLIQKQYFFVDENGYKCDWKSLKKSGKLSQISGSGNEKYATTIKTNTAQTWHGLILQLRH